jgi:hypothetical protein
MPPVALRYKNYPLGSPQRVVQDAVASRYPDSAEIFFNEIAAALSIQPGSASGTFYGFLGARRSLPVEHRKLYREKLGVTDAVLDRIAAERDAKTVEGSAHLAQLATEVDELRAAGMTLLRILEFVAGQVEALGGEFPRDLLREAELAMLRMPTGDHAR